VIKKYLAIASCNIQQSLIETRVFSLPFAVRSGWCIHFNSHISFFDDYTGLDYKHVMCPYSTPHWWNTTTYSKISTAIYSLGSPKTKAPWHAGHPFNCGIFSCFGFLLFKGVLSSRSIKISPFWSSSQLFLVLRSPWISPFKSTYCSLTSFACKWRYSLSYMIP